MRWHSLSVLLESSHLNKLFIFFLCKAPACVLFLFYSFCTPAFLAGPGGDLTPH